MTAELSGKTALVTGSTAGIGLAIAIALARAGAAVAVNGRTEARVREAAAAVARAQPGARIIPAAADCSTAAGVAALIRQLPEADILVNNVAIFEPKPFFEIPDEDWLRFFEVNVMSAVRLSRHYTPGMVERGWGRVLFISSESGLQIPAEMVHYGMTKTAMLAVSRGLAESIPGTGVTVNAVLPGPTRSEGVGGFLDALARRSGKTPEAVEAEFFETARPTSLLKRFTTTEEVAHMVAYLASPRASATTGSALRVDGGVVRAIA